MDLVKIKKSKPKPKSILKDIMKDISNKSVAELRADLQHRELSIKGTKTVLMERLQDAIEAEVTGAESSGSEEDDTSEQVYGEDLDLESNENLHETENISDILANNSLASILDDSDRLLKNLNVVMEPPSKKRKHLHQDNGHPSENIDCHEDLTSLNDKIPKTKDSSLHFSNPRLAYLNDTSNSSDDEMNAESAETEACATTTASSSRQASPLKAANQNNRKNKQPLNPASAETESQPTATTPPASPTRSSPTLPLTQSGPSSSRKKRKLKNAGDFNFLNEPAEKMRDTETAPKARRSVPNYEDLCRLDSNASNVEGGDNEEDGDELSDATEDNNETSRGGRSVTIRDIYRMPQKSKTPASIYATVAHILNQEVEVSPLNRSCRDYTNIRSKAYRDELRRKYGAKLRKHTDHEDHLILKRFAKLKKAEVFKDFNEFCESVVKFCSKKEMKNHKGRRNLKVRNIIGLYVGQDLPHKLAYYNYDRLITLVLDESPRLWKINYTLDPYKMKDRNKKRWTLEEDLDLLESVIKTQKKIVTSVEGIEDDRVDWSSLAEQKNRFGDRSRQNLREHWKRRIYPALINESDIRELLIFRQKLLKRISKQGATIRNDIDWDKLAKKFHPKTKTCLVG